MAPIYDLVDTSKTVQHLVPQNTKHCWFSLFIGQTEEKWLIKSM